MSLNAVQQSQVVQMYMALLGTTPTIDALASYATIFKNAAGNDTAKLLAVANSLTESAAGQRLYNDFFTPAQKAATIFKNIGLDGAAKDKDGVTLDFIADGILKVDGVTPASFATALVTAINSNTFDPTADPMNGHLVAGAASKAAYGVNLTTGVAGTKVAAAIDSALGLTPVTNDPVSLSFTTGADELKGGLGNDTFTGILASTSTFGTGDKVDGGAGTDTVTITTSSFSTAPMAELTNVEKVSVKQLASTTFDAILWKGVTEVSSAGGIGGATLTVSNLQGATPKFMLDGGSLVTSQHLTTSHLDLTGAADSVSVSLSNTSASTITLNGDAGAYETVTIALPSSGNLTLAGTGMSATTAIVIEGPATSVGTPIRVTVDSTVNAVGNFTLTGAPSAATISLGAGSSNSTITLSDGRESLSIGSAGNKTIKTGDGNDTVTFSSSSAGNITLDAGSGNDSVTLANLGNHNITLGDGADTLVGGATIGNSDTISGGSGADVLSFTAQTGVTSPVITGVEEITVTFANNGRSVSFKNVDDATTVKIVPGANATNITELDQTVKTVSFVNSGTTTGEPSQAAKIFYAADASATLALNFVSGNNANITLDEVANLTVDVTGMASASTDGAYRLDGTLTLNNGSDEDPMKVTINSRSGGGTLNLAATSNVESLTINSIGVGGSGTGTYETFTVQGFSASNVATGASGLTSLKLTAATANLTLASELNAPNLSTVTIEAGAGTTVKLNALTNADSVNVTSLVLSVGCGATVHLDDLNLVNVADGSFKLTSTGSAATVLVGTSGYLTAASGFDNNGILDEFYTTVDARALGDGSLKMFSGGTTTNSGTIFNGFSGTTAASGYTYVGGSGTTAAARFADFLNSGNEILRGYDTNANAMTIYGASSGSNYLAGGAGADTIYGGAGADLILGGAGNDRLDGGRGNDTILGWGSDTIIGGLGDDTIFAVATANGVSFRLNGGSGIDSIYLSNAAAGSGATDTIVWTIGDDVGTAGTIVYGFTGGSAFTGADKVDLTGTTTDLSIGATASVTVGSTGQTLAFGSATYITLTHFEGHSGTPTTSGYLVESGSPDFWNATTFSNIFGSGSAGGTSGLNIPFATTVAEATDRDWNSGYGVSFNGTSGASAVLTIEGSGGNTYMLLLATTVSSGTQTLTTANLVSVITLNGYTGALVGGVE